MTKIKTRATKSALGASLLAGGMLLAIPAAIASADDADSGVNGRPALEHAAPGVDAVQKAGDNFFHNHSFPDASDVGPLSRARYGRSTAPPAKEWLPKKLSPPFWTASTPGAA